MEESLINHLPEEEEYNKESVKNFHEDIELKYLVFLL